MIYVNVSPQEFAKKWDLPLDQVYRCPYCDKDYPINIPVYTQSSAGFVSKDHGCEFMQGFVGTPRTEKALAFWDKFI